MVAFRGAMPRRIGFIDSTEMASARPLANGRASDATSNATRTRGPLIAVSSAGPSMGRGSRRAESTRAPRAEPSEIDRVEVSAPTPIASMTTRAPGLRAQRLTQAPLPLRVVLRRRRILLPALLVALRDLV